MHLLTRFGKPGPTAIYLIAGGPHGHGQQKQKAWTFGRVVDGSMLWWGLMVLKHGAVLIIKKLMQTKPLVPKMHFATKPVMTSRSFRICSGKMSLVKPLRAQK